MSNKFENPDSLDALKAGSLMSSSEFYPQAESFLEQIVDSSELCSLALKIWKYPRMIKYATDLVKGLNRSHSFELGKDLPLWRFLPIRKKLLENIVDHKGIDEDIGISKNDFIHITFKGWSALKLLSVRDELKEICHDVSLYASLLKSSHFDVPDAYSKLCGSVDYSRWFNFDEVNKEIENDPKLAYEFLISLNNKPSVGNGIVLSLHDRYEDLVLGSVSKSVEHSYNAITNSLYQRRRKRVLPQLIEGLKDSPFLVKAISELSNSELIMNQELLMTSVLSKKELTNEFLDKFSNINFSNIYFSILTEALNAQDNSKHDCRDISSVKEESYWKLKLEDPENVFPENSRVQFVNDEGYSRDLMHLYQFSNNIGLDKDFVKRFYSVDRDVETRKKALEMYSKLFHDFNRLTHLTDVDYQSVYDGFSEVLKHIPIETIAKADASQLISITTVYSLSRPALLEYVEDLKDWIESDFSDDKFQLFENFLNERSNENRGNVDYMNKAVEYLSVKEFMQVPAHERERMYHAHELLSPGWIHEDFFENFAIMVRNGDHQSWTEHIIESCNELDPDLIGGDRYRVATDTIGNYREVEVSCK